MDDADRTQEQRLAELARLRRRVADLETLEFKRQEAETALRQHEAKYLTLLDDIEEGFFEVDLAGNLTFFNEALRRVIGYSADELLGMNNRQFMDAATAQTVYQVFNTVYRTGEPAKSYGWELIRKDGTRRMVETSVSLIYDTWGQPSGFRGLAHDVTERQQVETALQESEARYRAMVEDQVDFIVRWRPDGTRTFANGAYCRYLGLSLEQMINTSIVPSLRPEDWQTVRGQIAQLTPDQPFMFHTHLKFKPNGDAGWVEWTARAFFDETGRVVEVQSVGRDVTERKQAERLQTALLQIAQAAHSPGSLNDLAQMICRQISGLIDVTNFYVALYDPKQDLYTFPYWTDERDSDFGPQRMADGLTDHVRKTGKPRFVDQNLYQQLIASGAVKQVGSMAVHWLGAPLRTSQGVIGVVVVQSYREERLYSAHDLDLLTVVADHIAAIIERKQAEEELRKSEERYRALFESAPVGISVSVLEGPVLMINAAMKQMLGYSREDLESTDARVIYQRPEDRVSLLEQFKADGVVRDFEVSLRQKNGAPYYASMTIIPLPIMGENIVLTLLLDITERKVAEQQSLELALGRERMRILAQFIQNASHEFKTPLSMINLQLHILKRQIEAPECVERMQQIELQAQKIATLVDDLVTMARLDSSVPLETQLVNVTEVIRAAQEALAELSSSANVPILWESDPQEGIFLHGDLDEIHLAVINLLKNALRYTPAGGKVSVRIGYANGQVVIEIRDTGIGMDDVVLSHIFERFYRADVAHTTGGFGLGLPIAQKIVERHGGHIDIESQPGQGSLFRIVLPIDNTYSY